MFFAVFDEDFAVFFEDLAVADFFDGKITSDFFFFIETIIAFMF